MAPQRSHGGRNLLVTKEGLRTLQRQVQAIQEDLHKGLEIRKRDESKDEAKEEGRFEEEQDVVGYPKQVKMLEVVSKIGERPNIKVSNFFENVNLKELINWINIMDEQFEYEEVEDLEKVKFTKRKLEGHASIQQKEVQSKRNKRGKKI